MTSDEQNIDRMFDESLRTLGPRLSQPTVSDSVKAKIAELVAAPSERSLSDTAELTVTLLNESLDPNSSRTSESKPSLDTFVEPQSRLHVEMERSLRSRINVYACVTAALSLALLVATIFIVGARREANRLRSELRQEQLRSAALQRRSEYLIGTEKTPRYVLVEFHHDQCPFSKQVVPYFDKLAARYGANQNVLFLRLDVTGSKAKDSIAVVNLMRMNYLFVNSSGVETGALKLVDTEQNRVVGAFKVGSTADPLEAMLEGVASQGRLPDRE